MKWLLAAAAVAAFSVAAAGAEAAPILLTFEGAGDFAQVNDFYNGGTDSLGNAGPDVGVSFTADLDAIRAFPNGHGFFQNNPSGDTVLFAVDGVGDVMDVAAGFSTGFAFFYSAVQAGGVSVYDGLHGGGNLLGHLDLPPVANGFETWNPEGLAFAGVAHSVVFQGPGQGLVAFDNLTLGATRPILGDGGGVPEPAAWALMIAGFGLAGAALRSRRALAAG